MVLFRCRKDKTLNGTAFFIAIKQYTNITVKETKSMKKSKLRCGGQILYIPTDLLISDPTRPRIYFNNNELNRLSDSICEVGIIKPITVRNSKTEKYYIVSGERRYRAAVMAGLSTIPCILTKMSNEDAAFTSLYENLQQCNLNFFEVAVAIERLHKSFAFSYSEIADRLGLTLAEVNEKTKLLTIPFELRTKIIESGITEQHAKEIVRLNDEDKENFVDEIVEKRLNVSSTREKCTEIIYGKREKPQQKTVTYFKDITIFVNTIDKAINAMNSSGINAQSSKTEAEGYIEYRVTIPR